jgi:hypothetical protein
MSIPSCRAAPAGCRWASTSIPNNACNWACVYCQVPDLQRGTAPEIDLAQLEAELRAMLADILHGDFMQTRVPEGARRLNDIALSGNGEPTSARAFPQVIELIGRVMADFDLVNRKIKLVLITNGSLADRRACGRPGKNGGAERRGVVQVRQRDRRRHARRQPDPHFTRQAVRASGRGRAPVPDLAADLRVRAGRQAAVGSGTGGLSGRGGTHPAAIDPAAGRAAVRPGAAVDAAAGEPAVGAARRMARSVCRKIRAAGLPVKVSP